MGRYIVDVSHRKRKSNLLVELRSSGSQQKNERNSKAKIRDDSGDGVRHDRGDLVGGKFKYIHVKKKHDSIHKINLQERLRSPKEEEKIHEAENSNILRRSNFSLNSRMFSYLQGIQRVEGGDSAKVYARIHLRHLLQAILEPKGIGVSRGIG